MTAISSIYVYVEPRCAVVDYDDVAAHVRQNLPGVAVSLRGRILEDSVAGDSAAARQLATALAGAKVRKLGEPAPRRQKSLPGEVEYELRRLANPDGQAYGLLYDAGAMLEVYRGFLPEMEARRQDTLHVIFTNQLIGNWDAADKRYHARTVICSSPSIISLSGLVEAPAREPGYYLARRSSEALGFQEEAKMELARFFAGDYLTFDDSRMTEAAKGYVMAAASYRMTGEAFCADPDCGLFNAHWQRELIRAQLGGPYEYCEPHSRVFRQCKTTQEAPWR